MVSAGVQIGSNVTLFHGVTLGQKDTILANGERVSGFPVIGNNVWIGPHAIVVGDTLIEPVTLAPVLTVNVAVRVIGPPLP